MYMINMGMSRHPVKYCAKAGKSEPGFEAIIWIYDCCHLVQAPRTKTPYILVDFLLSYVYWIGTLLYSIVF